MPFSTVVPELMIALAFKPIDSKCNGFHLSQSKLFPYYLSSLDSISKALQDRISDLELRKLHIESTYQRYITYSEHPEEQRISLYIFSQHVNSFRLSFIKLLEFTKHEKWTNGMADILLPATGWHKARTSSVAASERPEISACRRFLQYNLDAHIHNKPAAGSGEIYSFCVDELLNLVRTVCEISKELAATYWDEQIQIVLVEAE